MEQKLKTIRVQYNTMNIQEQFQQKISAITEDVGRGKGPLLFGGIKDAISNGIKSFHLDFGNGAPPIAKFNVMNYYTLDVRVKETDIIQPFQASTKAYTENILEAVEKYIGTVENTRRIKQILKEALKKESEHFKTEYRKKQRKKQAIEGAESVEEDMYNKFDMTVFKILNEMEESDVSADLILKDLGIHKGDIIVYSPKDKSPMQAIIRNMPGERIKSGVIADGYIRISPVNDNKKTYTVPIEKDGHINISIYIEGWHTDWDDDSVTIEDIKRQDRDMADRLEDLAPIIVGNKADGKSYACVVNPNGFAQVFISALVSSFRGKVKQGVTLEEILTGKFTQKVINPEKGAFINKIKDPTSRQPLDFRAWSEPDLEVLHNIILYAFITKPNSTGSAWKRAKDAPDAIKDKYHRSMKVDVTEFGLKDAVFYMSEEDFDRFVKGGEGLKNLAKGLSSELSSSVKVLNI
jgi:hypothetical protein